MSLYSQVESGAKLYRSRFNLSHRKIFDCDFGFGIPFLAKFVLPGDIWNIGANALIRYQPTLSPILTKANARFRYFFVPLRLVESNIEEVITGSKNGHLVTGQLPVCKKMFDNVEYDANFKVAKYSFLDYLGLPCVDYKNIKNDACIPAMYWMKAYARIWYDYYRDENLDTSYDDPETYYNFVSKIIGTWEPFSVRLRKDYFTSSLPWQLKGVTPTFSVASNVAVISGDNKTPLVVGNINQNAQVDAWALETSGPMNIGDNIGVDASFTVDDLRTLTAQTRIFERLARCGSRYTEYLRSNFGTAPADGTLQRAQYLGGFKEPIVTTEVVQTGPNTDSSSVRDRGVGTLRGHGISSFSNTIRSFVAKEFGVLIGIMDVMPDIQYTQGINRELTYTSRFDFFNPSFQHLSEQEVRNGEVYISNDGKNDDTFGFNGIYNELRKSTDIVVGDMRDTLSYWTQAINFSSRPNLNSDFIKAINHGVSFKRPFAVTSGAMPIICDVANVLDVYRPMVRYATPGLLDHN